MFILETKREIKIGWLYEDLLKDNWDSAIIIFLHILFLQVTEPQQIRDHENEFNIISVERSFTLAAR